MRNVVMTLALVGMFVLLAGPVQATYLTHSTEGTLFDETYESQTVGSILATGNIDPNGNSETWYAYEGPHGGGTVEARNAASDALLDANEGNQYALLQRPGGTNPAAELYGNFLPDIGSGTLTMEFAWWLPTSLPAYGFQFYFDNLDSGRSTSTSDRSLMLAVNGGNVMYYSSGWIDTGLDVAFDEWQEVTIVYDLVAGADNDTFDLTVADSTATGLDVNQDLTDVSRFAFATGSGGHFYVDAIVPEPSTLVLLSMGLVGLICYAWRKRK